VNNGVDKHPRPGAALWSAIRLQPAGATVYNLQGQILAGGRDKRRCSAGVVVLGSKVQRQRQVEMAAGR